MISDTQKEAWCLQKMSNLLPGAVMHWWVWQKRQKIEMILSHPWENTHILYGRPNFNVFLFYFSLSTYKTKVRNWPRNRKRKMLQRGRAKTLRRAGNRGHRPVCFTIQHANKESATRLLRPSVTIYTTVLQHIVWVVKQLLKGLNLSPVKMLLFNYKIMSCLKIWQSYSILTLVLS